MRLQKLDKQFEHAIKTDSTVTKILFYFYQPLFYFSTKNTHGNDDTQRIELN